MSSSTGPGVPLALPRTADGRVILSRADLDGYDPRPICSGGRERFYCPAHGGDHQRSLAVDPDTGRYHCHTCKTAGMLKDFWPNQGPAAARSKPRRAAASSYEFEQRGRAILDAKAREEAERAERMAAALPADAALFLGRLDVFSHALRDPDCPGAAYLRSRGLDPEMAADLGAGYVEPNVWPTDHGRKVGRIVYPLGDPRTGRVVSALGRLCADEDSAWPEQQRQKFKAAKQRKLTGCPAGVWPYTAIAAARQESRPLGVVEGPADVLALVQGASRLGRPLHCVALLGTSSDILPASTLRGLPGVVAALDDDDSGRKAALSLRVDLAIDGIRVQSLPDDWLGGVKDAGELAKAVACGVEGSADTYERAIKALMDACDGLVERSWDDGKAQDAIAAMYGRCADACAEAAPPYPVLPDDFDQAVDEACARRNWADLVAALDQWERWVRDQLASRMCRAGA